MLLITCPNCHTTMECDGVGDLNAKASCPVCHNPFVPGENIERSAEKQRDPKSSPGAASPRKDQPDVLAALEDIKKELKKDQPDVLAALEDIKKELKKDQPYVLAALEDIKKELKKDQPYVLAALEDIKKELKGVHKDTSYVRKAWLGLDLALLIIISLVLYANCTRLRIPLSRAVTMPAEYP